MCMYEPSPLTKYTNTTPTHQAVRDCLQYRGPPDPLKGEAPYQMVREAAKETLEAIYETAPPGGAGGCAWGGCFGITTNIF